MRPSEVRIREKVEELLHLVQLGWMKDRLPSELSGGQRQRVALARALAVAPKVLLHQGRVEQVGTPEEIFRAPASAFVSEFLEIRPGGDGIGAPSSYRSSILLTCAVSSGTRFRTRSQTISGSTPK